jgi:1-acyl-sn-glycerol-3-phosphate acyltransferase
LNIFIIFIRPVIGSKGHHLTQKIIQCWVNGLQQIHRYGLSTLTINIVGDSIDRDTCPLILANHQSFMDIILLFWAYPLHTCPKYVLKKPLIYMPVIGISWWLLGYPFLARSKDSQSNNLATLKQEIERQKKRPSPLIIFPESHRFAQKYRKPNSPYKHLLPPHPIGCALLMEGFLSLNRPIYTTTIVYHDHPSPSLWQCLCGTVSTITIEVEKLDTQKIPRQTQPNYRRAFWNWIMSLWQQQDQRIGALKNKNLDSKQ